MEAYPRSIPGAYSAIHTDNLPEDIELKVSQGVEHMGAADGLREVSYNFLIYRFAFRSGRQIVARYYLDGAGDPVHILSCTESGSAAETLSAATCKGWIEFKQAVLTLTALDYVEIDYLGDEGYTHLDRSELGITEADVDEWIVRCTVSAYPGRPQ